MKERKFREKLKSIAIGLVVILAIISAIVSATFILDVIPNASTGIKVMTYITFGVCVVILAIMLCRVETKSDTLELAREQYGDYIKLVDEQLGKMTIEPEDVLPFALMFRRSSGSDYLVYFSNELDNICDRQIVGKLDSFIVASCLLYGLIMSPKIITSKEYDKDAEVELTAAILNARLALNCALEIISEPSTYYEDDTGNWIEEKHPKVDISIPNGLIKNDVLYDRIIKAFIKYDPNYFPIMQFSNLLHLKYLNCQNNQ